MGPTEPPIPDRQATENTGETSGDLQFTEHSVSLQASVGQYFLRVFESGSLSFATGSCWTRCQHMSSSCCIRLWIRGGFRSLHSSRKRWVRVRFRRRLHIQKASPSLLLLSLFDEWTENSHHHTSSGKSSGIGCLRSQCPLPFSIGCIHYWFCSQPFHHVGFQADQSLCSPHLPVIYLVLCPACLFFASLLWSTITRYSQAFPRF